MGYMVYDPKSTRRVNRVNRIKCKTNSPTIAINILGQIYTNIDGNDLSTILIEYPNRIHADSHLITNFDITADKD